MRRVILRSREDAVGFELAVVENDAAAALSAASEHVLLRVCAVSMSPPLCADFDGGGLCGSSAVSVGCIAAGVVSSVGPSSAADSPPFAVGDFVLCAVPRGACADEISVPFFSLLRIPPPLSPAVAVASAHAGLNALSVLVHSLRVRRDLSAGAVVLITDAASPAGSFAVQLSRSLCCGRVVACVRDTAEAALLSELLSKSVQQSTSSSAAAVRVVSVGDDAESVASRERKILAAVQDNGCSGAAYIADFGSWMSARVASEALAMHGRWARVVDEPSQVPVSKIPPPLSAADAQLLWLKDASVCFARPFSWVVSQQDSALRGMLASSLDNVASGAVCLPPVRSFSVLRVSEAHALASGHNSSCCCSVVLALSEQTSTTCE